VELSDQLSQRFDLCGRQPLDGQDVENLRHLVMVLIDKRPQLFPREKLAFFDETAWHRVPQLKF
jgi:hypothetical protein